MPGLRVIGALALSLGILSAHSHAISPRPPIGTNLAGIVDWSTDFPFNDVFKTSRPWISGSRTLWSDSRPIDLDARGWIRSLQAGQIARTLMFWDLSRVPGQFPAGRYVVEYEGAGVIEYHGSARRVDQRPGRDVLEVDPARGGGIGLVISSTDPGNYIRNIRVSREGVQPSVHLFNNEFLDRLRGYRAIRFMDWMATNDNGRRDGGSRQQRWSDRPRLEDARWSGFRGVPLEVMVALVNSLEADPWFCMPHLADDEYVLSFARAVRELLQPRLKVYVEYSNEVWNRRFAQAQFAEREGLDAGLSANPREAGVRFHAKRSVEIFRIWERVFPRDRLVRVLGSQAASQWVSETALSSAGAAARVDALAIAPYFTVGPREFDRVRTMNLDQFMELLASDALPQAREQMIRQMETARRHGVSLIAYEAGQHLVGVGAALDDARLNELFDAANRDPRMGTLYTRYLNDWAEVGGGLLMHFTNVSSMRKFGRWGALEYMLQPRAQAPKYDALQRFMEGR
jgi:hypothetical protein